MSDRTSAARTLPARIALALAAAPRYWLDLIDFDPVSRHYARIDVITGAEAWLLTWLPGQGTDWHDHGDSEGAFTVVSGALQEDRAIAAGTGLVAGTPQTWRRGSLRTFGTDHVHRVTNPGIEPAISLHVYSPRLTRMNRYRVDGGAVVPAGSDRVGADW